MYIKQDIEVKNVNIVSEPVEKYGMKEELIEKFVLAQKRLFGEILDRLDRLEENKTGSKTPRPDNG